MATVQQASAKAGGTGQYESFVEKQLADAKRRVRGLDLAKWGCILASVILGYGLLESLADLLWELPTAVRFSTWCLLVIVSAALLALALSRIFFQKVSARFLARQLELTVPQAKNSVINWLDLREEPLSPVIRGSLGRRAAKDLGHADAERALSARAVWWLGGVATILLFIQLGWLVFAPGQAWSLLQRAFLPFDAARIALRTSLTLLVPAAGDVSVPANQDVKFRVQADGYVPDVNHADSLKLHFRYQKDEPFEERALQRDVDGVWTTTVLADQVRAGFWYKITGGDAQVPEDREYRVDVLTAPQVLRYDATFKYRPYLQFKDISMSFDKNVRSSIRAMRGTELTLVVRTNRALKLCTLELTEGGAKRMLSGEAVPGDPEAWKFRWVIDQSGEFRILFMSKEGEENVDRQPGNLEVIPDNSPKVAITKPAQEISLPANGTLYVEGNAEDDFGVKSMQLRFKLLQPANNTQLNPKLYRPDLSFQLPNGKYPQLLEYSDFVALDSIRTIKGEAFPLSAGMELEYWLEARDNCDYPDIAGNLGQSLKHKLRIGPPETNKGKADQDRKSAQQQAEQNQKKQDGKLDGQKMQAAAEKNAEEGNKDGKQGESNQGNQGLDNEAKRVDEAIKDANKLGSAKGNDDNQANPKDSGSDGKAEQGKDPPSEKKGTGGNEKKQDNPSKGGDSTAGKDPGKQPDTGDKNQPKDAKGDGKEPPDSKKGGDPKAGGQDNSKGKGDPSASKVPPDTSKSGDPKDGDKGGGGKAEPKGSGKDDPTRSKGADPKDGTGDSGKAKSPGAKGADDAAKAGSGNAKDGTSTEKSAVKDAPLTKEPAAGVKGGQPDPSAQPPADGKAEPPDSSKTAGDAKGSDRKDATMEDVAKLKEQLGEAGMRELAKKALEKIGEQASDPKVRQEAEKSLEQTKSQPNDSKTGDQTGDISKSGVGNNDSKSNSKQGDTGAGPGAQSKPGTNQDDKTDPSGKADSSGKGKAGQPKNANPTGKGVGTVGPVDPGQVNPVDEAAARRAGELQLENLKQQIDKLRGKFTPEVMKNLNWTDKEREDFLRKMMAEALNRQQQQKLSPDKLPPPGSIMSLLPGSGPRNLQQDPTNKGAVINENPQAPPEVRDALRLFNGKK